MESWRTRLMRTQERSIIHSTEGAFKAALIESHRNPVLSCEFHKTGRVLASSNSAGQIYIFPTNSRTEKLAYLRGHMDTVTEVHYSTDGLDLYSASMDRCIGVWDAFLAVRKTIINAHNNGVNTVQCSRTSKPILCSGSSDKTVRVWDLRERECSAMFKTRHEIAATCFSDCYEYVFSGGFNNGDISLWDTRQNNIVQVLTGHRDSVTGLSLSPCGNYLASCSAAGTLRTWDVSSAAEIGTEIQCFPLKQGDSTHLRRCAWSADGIQLSAGTSESKAVVFDADSGERLHEFDGHSEEIIDVAFHPEKKVLCSAGADKRLIMHNYM